MMGKWGGMGGNEGELANILNVPAFFSILFSPVFPRKSSANCGLVHKLFTTTSPTENPVKCELAVTHRKVPEPETSMRGLAENNGQAARGRERTTTRREDQKRQ